MPNINIILCKGRISRAIFSNVLHDIRVHVKYRKVKKAVPLIDYTNVVPETGTGA